MAIRKVSFAPGEFFHIYNRGNSKQLLFHDTQDYERCMMLLFICNQEQPVNIGNSRRKKDFFSQERSEPIVSIGAFCLMPNHFHLLITSDQDDGISKFMQRFSTAYVMYYNKRYGHKGSLFEGKFKAEHASNDRYLRYIFSYIHLNPLKLFDSSWRILPVTDKSQALRYLESYPYSSFSLFTGINRSYNAIARETAFPNYFETKEKFLKEINTWLSYNDQLS